MDTVAIKAVGQIDSFGDYAGLALILLVIFIGFNILWHGWPDWRRRK